MRTWKQMQAESLAAMSESERQEYDQASVEAQARIELAQIVYEARQKAGISQTELAARAGTRQAVISAIETGAQAPGGIMLVNIANAVGAQLKLEQIAA